MDNRQNLAIYRRWAPVYDLFFKPVSARARRRAINLLALQPGERLFLPGVGTGLDLLLLPPGIGVVAGDLNPVMLRRAAAKPLANGLHLLDAQRLALPNACCEAALLSLIVSVAPDGAAVLAEASRVLKPGGRVVIFDKFLPERAGLSAGRRLLGAVAAGLGTDINRRLGDILTGAPDLSLDHNEPSLLGGQYRLVRLWKKGPA